MTKSNRMLVAAPERWDEACFAVPAVRALAASGLQVGVFCGQGQEAFWRTVEGIEVVVFRGKPKAADVVRDWDAALAWDAGAVAKAVRGAGVARRIAPAGDQKLAKWATDAVATKMHVLEHRVRHYLATVEALGVATREVRFFTAADVGGARRGEGVLLCPDSDFGASHEWPLERWKDVATQLREVHGRDVAVACMHGENRLADALGGDVVRVDASSFSGMLPRLAGYPLVVAADGSLPHLAAHAGATCVVLFGPNDAAWRRPLGRRHAVVRRHVECAPCLLAKCPLDHRCQQRLEVRVVMEAVAGILSGGAPG